MSEMKLSEIDKKILYMVHTLRPYERIEIRLENNEPGKISVVSTLTIKEVFPNTNNESYENI